MKPTTAPAYNPDSSQSFYAPMRPYHHHRPASSTTQPTSSPATHQNVVTTIWIIIFIMANIAHSQPHSRIYPHTRAPAGVYTPSTTAAAQASTGCAWWQPPATLQLQRSFRHGVLGEGASVQSFTCDSDLRNTTTLRHTELLHYNASIQRFTTTLHCIASLLRCVRTLIHCARETCNIKTLCPGDLQRRLLPIHFTSL